MISVVGKLKVDGILGTGISLLNPVYVPSLITIVNAKTVCLSDRHPTADTSACRLMHLNSRRAHDTTSDSRTTDKTITNNLGVGGHQSFVDWILTL